MLGWLTIVPKDIFIDYYPLAKWHGIFVSAFWLLKMFFDEPGEGLLHISGYAIVMPCSAPMDPSTSWVLNPS